MAAKKRSENFSPDEILFIIELVEKHIDIIQSKQTNQVTNAKKTDCWRKITESVNARGGVCRTIEQVKEKYRKACSKAKGESVSQRVHQKKDRRWTTESSPRCGVKENFGPARGFP